jgi:hypothetical protein
LKVDAAEVVDFAAIGSKPMSKNSQTDKSVLTLIFNRFSGLRLFVSREF